jgi:hypothetical protein
MCLENRPTRKNQPTILQSNMSILTPTMRIHTPPSGESTEFSILHHPQLDSFSQQGHIVLAGRFPLQLRSTPTKLSSQRKQVYRHRAIV